MCKKGILLHTVLQHCVLSFRSYGKIIVISSSSPWAFVHYETTLGSASLHEEPPWHPNKQQKHSIQHRKSSDPILELVKGRKDLFKVRVIIYCLQTNPSSGSAFR